MHLETTLLAQQPGRSCKMKRIYSTEQYHWGEFESMDKGSRFRAWTWEGGKRQLVPLRHIKLMADLTHCLRAISPVTLLEYFSGQR